LQLAQVQQRLQSALTHAMQNQNWRWQTLQQRLRSVRPDLMQLSNRHVELGRRLQEAVQRMLERYDNRLAAAQQHLLHLDPQQVLARGYSMVRDERGAVVVDSEKLALGQRLQVTFARGWASVELKEKGG
jgi:exodeoxyribonuclease VII large subunit